VYEADTLARFQGHCNIVSLYSFWSEKPQNPYTFKTLTVLMEEGILGDMLTTVVRNPKRPPPRISLKYLCDLAKGMIAVHNCNIIHARVKPSSMYLSGDNTAMVGELGKTELDHARNTHQLYSKLLIGEALPKTLGYWAPELLRGEKYGKEVDMWALGVSIYQIVTGEHPFNIDDEVISTPVQRQIITSFHADSC
jgi:serine/threonine protein kinase